MIDVDTKYADKNCPVTIVRSFCPGQLSASAERP